MNEREERRRLDLPADLVERVEHRLPGTEFDSTEAYVAYVLEELLSHVEESVPAETEDVVDEAQVKDRLRALGYVEE